MTKFWKARFECNVERRVPETFLVGLKKQLVAWGYAKEEIRVFAPISLQIDGAAVVKTGVIDKALVLHWQDEWASWKEFAGSDELQALKTHAPDVLSRVGVGGKEEKW